MIEHDIQLLQEHIIGKLALTEDCTDRMDLIVTHKSLTKYRNVVNKDDIERIRKRIDMGDYEYVVYLLNMIEERYYED